MPGWLRKLGAVVLEGAAGSALAAGATAIALSLLSVDGGGPLIVAAGGIGLLNGVIAALLGIYKWSSPVGWLAFLLDHTWGLVGTTIAMLLHTVNLFWFGGRKYNDSLSRGKNRYLYDGGFGFSGYAFTQGLVTSNFNNSTGNKLVEHETLHIWQSRAFGPLFQATYGVWFLVGAIVGTFVSLGRKQSWYQTVTDIAYLDNPWETWAYKIGGTPRKGKYSWV